MGDLSPDWCLLPVGLLVQDVVGPALDLSSHDEPHQVLIWLQPNDLHQDC